MSIAEPPYANLAHSIVQSVRDETTAEADTLDAAFNACGSLSAPLKPLMGLAGYQAILSRAVSVARVQTKGLDGVEVESDGGLKNSAPSDSEADPQEKAMAGPILLCSLITLLVAFIGENLTFRMISDVWPALEHPDLNFSKEIKNERIN